MISNHVLPSAPVTDDDDLYSGFNESHPALDTRNLQGDENFQEAVSKSSYGRRGFTGKRQTGPSRMGTAGFRKTGTTPTTSTRRNSQQQQVPPTARPVTALRGAGYTSSSRVSSGTSFDPLNQAKTFISNFQGKDDTTPEAKIKALEKKVNTLLDESVMSSYRGDVRLGLDKGKEAVAKERTLAKQKERLKPTEGIAMNNDLYFAVQFNLAIQLANNEMYSEAIETYNSISKNRSFVNAGRLKLNVGNIYYLQGNYSKAIKMYRMALDQVANTQKNLRMEIMKNIGLTFVKLNQFTDAVTSFEYIMSEKPDQRTALHLIVCHYAINDRESMKKSFTELLNAHSAGKKAHHLDSPSLDDEDEDNDENGRQFLNEVIRSDGLKIMETEKQNEEEWCILTAAKLISPVILDSINSGFEWTIEQIRNSGHSDLSDDLEINKAVKHLKKREFNHAIETLKRFEKKDGKSAVTAATNLSFLYLLQNESSQAEKYADQAIDSDRYNVGALVNKGNCMFVKNDVHRAQAYYQEALSHESTCPEALYNYILASKKLGHFDQALDAAFKLNLIVKNHPYSLFQIANIYELLNDRDQSLDWYQKLLAFVPSDPSLLNRLSDVADAERDRHQALSYLNESFRYFPSHIPTIERLASHYIENQAYEKAIKFLEKASAVQPNEIKWHLMVAACLRRSGNYQAALNSYAITHKKFPENTECLKFLIRLCDDLGVQDGREYAEKLKRIEKSRDLNNQRKDLRTASRTSKRSAASSREGSASSNSSGYVTESSRINGRKPAHEPDIMLKNDFNDDLDTNERPTTSWRRKAVDEDDFEGDEVDAILPE